MSRILTEQELHNLAMNIVGHTLEDDGFEFLAVNSELEKNPQFVCTKDGVLHFIIVCAIVYPGNPNDKPTPLLTKMRNHAEKFEAKTFYAGVGLHKSGDETAPLNLNDEYVVTYNGLRQVS